ncbi:MAG TPA: hypothetical protein PLC04_07415 [Candidatus Kapabacteria bacterium]|jgi:hypothetical protein|nr:hypothetical protein [Candidatus Kapabacteria bacterium]HOV92888.1 hypothetical protein [Candidatus Kapabacteria bacterium]
MKKFTFYNIFIIFIFFGFQFYSNAQEQTQQIQDTTQVKNDSLTNNIDTTQTPETEIDEDNEYGINDLMTTIVKPLLKKYTHRVEKSDHSIIFEDKPFISLFVGQVNIDNKKLNPDINQSADIQLLLGYSDRKQYPNSNLIRTKNRYITFKNLSNDLIDFSKQTKLISASTWNFGFNRSKDYGWNFGQGLKINLTHSEGLHWSFMNFNITGIDSTGNVIYPEQLMELNDKLKFGEGFSGGIEFELFNHIGLSAGYERMDVFPVHLFWAWAVSDMIESAAQGIIDEFVSNVRKYSPWATPIISFALKNSISYGLYELRRKNMNWPFNSPAPYVFETFKVGLSYKF